MNANKQVLNEKFKRVQRLPDWPLTVATRSTLVSEEGKGAKNKRERQTMEVEEVDETYPDREEDLKSDL
jgi:hypothetical protein